MCVQEPSVQGWVQKLKTNKIYLTSSYNKLVDLAHGKVDVSSHNSPPGLPVNSYPVDFSVRVILCL